MNNAIWVSTALACLATAAVVSAQSNGPMQSNAPMSKGMADGKMDMSYSGCVEKDAKKGTYSLSHATAADSMMKDGMMKGMAMDSSKDAMANDMWLALTSKDIDLSKHVGHKVTVLGTGATPMVMGKEMPTMSSDKAMPKAKSMEMASFAVKSLTMVSSSCQ
ncbi:MAG: hypothetical protein ABI634_10145 [Acidobacteriota bacterium]